MASWFVHVLIMLAVAAFMIMRKKSMKAQLATDYAHSQASAVAHRLGFTLARGEPTTNLQIADKDTWDIQKVDVLLTGRPHGIPTKIIYYRDVNAVEVSGQRDLHTTHECRIVAETRTNCGRFEIRLKNPHDVLRAKSYFEKEQPLPRRSFGDPTLDSVLCIEADDPALPAKLAPQLGGLVGMTYVHVVGESGSVSYDMAHAEHGQHLGCAYGFHYIEQLPTLLASIVCVLESMAAPSAMPAGRMTEATSIPCRRCGATLREVLGKVSDTEVQLVCDWCGATDSLPADAARRVLALQVLAAERRWATDAATGPAVGLLAFAEGRYLSSLLVNGGFVVAMTLAIGLASGGAAGAFGPMAGAVLPLASALGGVALAFVFVRRRLRAVLGPILAAAPPATPGAPSRCRSCGGDIGYGNAGIAQCRYCGSSNLATAAIFAARAEALASAATRERRSAVNTQQVTAGLSQRIGWILSAGLLVGLALGFLVARLVS